MLDDNLIESNDNNQTDPERDLGQSLTAMVDPKYKDDLETMLAMGYDQRMVKKIFVFLKPGDINEAIDVATEIDGIYQHDFMERYGNKEKCFICNAPPNKHVNFRNSQNQNNDGFDILNFLSGLLNNNTTNNNNRNSRNNNRNNRISNNRNSNNRNNDSRSSENELIEIKDNNKNYLDFKEDEEQNDLDDSKIKCILCDDPIEGEEIEKNKISCGHFFCSECNLNYFMDKINNNKVGQITCMQNKCPNIYTEEFIIAHLNDDEKLINKFKKFKLKNELINDPNVKFCPIPNCESYARKEGDNKYVTCENGHKFCFNCSKDWHGSKKCDDVIDKDFLKWKKDKIVKRCPNCKMWTEKNHGCNHMTCVQCKYQWCWLCLGKYEPGHFDIGGGCAGLQFNENELFNNCICLFGYKLLIFVGMLLLTIIGFVPVTSCIITVKLSEEGINSCISTMLIWVGWFFWMIPFLIIGIGIMVVVSIPTLIYWRLQEILINYWVDLLNL